MFTSLIRYQTILCTTITHSLSITRKKIKKTEKGKLNLFIQFYILYLIIKFKVSMDISQRIFCKPLFKFMRLRYACI